MSSNLMKTLSKDEINTLLEDFIEIENIFDVKLGTFLRYFTINYVNGEPLKEFRLGGYLHKLFKDYIVLTNGRTTWSVQIADSIFYRELTKDEIKDEYEELLDEYEKEIMDLKHINKKLYKKLLNSETQVEIKPVMKGSSNKKSKNKK